MSFVEILIADDHESVRRSLRSLILSQPNWRVCGEAVDGFEAVAKTQELRPDVVLMDMSMPRMDGAEATRKILQDFPDSRIIIISQNEPALVSEMASKAGALGYVAKARVAKDLIPAISAAVSGSDRKSSTSSMPPRTEWLFGGGELGSRIRSFDWAHTPLGPIEQWPQSLRASVNLMLNSQHPMWIGWGPEMTFLYNDAYISVLSMAKHPWALGRSAREVWSEIWNVCGPLAEKVFSKGEPSFFEDVRLFMNRGEFLEETYYSFSYSPIYSESGTVGGLFCPSAETTAKVLSARRLRTLSELSARSLIEKTTHTACESCVQIISENRDDIPFALLYIFDSEAKIASLEGTTQVPEGLPRVSPSRVSAHDTDSNALWPIEAMARGAAPRIVSLKNVPSLPMALADQPIAEAIVLPVTSLGIDRPLGVLIAGVNPTRKLDTEYRTFFSLVADQVATAIQNANAVQKEKERLDALVELDRAKTAFFSNVSHEFRTPLTLMLGPLEDALIARAAPRPEHWEGLEVAHRNSVRLLRLVNTLLDFSRIEAGRMQASYQATDLAPFTSELASVFQSATERAGLRLLINCPPLSEPAYVDREMWEKIVFNLLSNAFKFTFEGEIEVSVHQRDGSAELSIRDTGTGIPEKELPHLFERFYRVKGANGRTFEGSGIGLSLVQELAHLHGGEVSVSSQLNHGSTFTVSIPLGKQHLPQDRIGAERTLESTGLHGGAYVLEALRWLPGHERDAPDILDTAFIAAAQPRLDASQGSSTRSHILIADDNADMREYVQRILRDRYEVTAVADGEAALKSALERRPDLIVSDVMMPRMDGFGLVQTVRGNDSLKHIPVILLSARAGEEAHVDGLQSGADDYLTKPFSARELLARVQSHLAMAQIRQQSTELERKLRLDSELLAAIVASSEDAIVSKTLDGIITSWNKSAQRTFGYTPEEAIGKHISLIIPPDRLDEEVHIIERLRRGERIEHFQTVRMRKDGTTLDVALTISPVRDSTGRVVGASKVARDITTEKLAEERERQITEQAVAANAKFRAVFEQTTVFAGIMTKDGLLVEANRMSLDACGLRAEDVLGKPFWQTGWWQRFNESREKIKAATPLAAKGIPYREILKYSWGDGSERLVDFALYPILDDKGEVLFLHPTGVDITDVKRAEENYRNLAERLDLEVKARTVELENRNLEVIRQSELLRAFSHRLLRAQDEERRRIARELHDSAGQTLTVLGISLAQLVQKTGRKAPELANDAESIQETVQQLHREIRTASYLLHPPLLDETGLASALSWYVQGLVQRSGLDINLSIPDDFGRLPREMELSIFRLVQESLTNIHRHSASKTASIRIARDAKLIRVDIRDQGKGISQERLSEIQSRGSGVGIRGMRERLREFDGTLEIESNDSGTHVLVEIPAPKQAVARDQNGNEPLEAAV